jgi:hypothetical protein
MKLLPIEAQRVGIGNTATDYRTSLIRQAVIELQRIIPSYKINHETIYYPEDLVREGLAVRGVRPPQSVFKDLSIFRLTDGVCDARFAGVPHEWSRRFELVHGSVCVNDKQCRYSMDPSGNRTFYIYPMPENEAWFVSMFWDGTKLEFQDDDQVPFTEATARAVALFVKANAASDVEDDLQKKKDAADEFEKMKPKLYIDDKETRGV